RLPRPPARGPAGAGGFDHRLRRSQGGLRRRRRGPVPAARGEDRRPGRRHGRGALRREAGRAGGGARGVPGRFRIPVEGRPGIALVEAARREEMIRKIITFSAHNRGLVIAAVAVALFGAYWSAKNIPLDALPDLSDTQVIVYSRWDRSPDIVEDQITY